jgi:hypothetical protein
MKRTQLTNFEASTKIFRTDRKRQLVLQPCRFGRLDGSNASNGPLVGLFRLLDLNREAC